MNKRFSQELLDSYQPTALQSLTTFLKKRNIQLNLNDNKFGVDTWFCYNGENYYVELETRDKEHWFSDQPKYRTITIPARKIKYLATMDLYVIVRHDGKMLGVLTKPKISRFFTDEFLVRKKTKYSGERLEAFYDIPRDEFEFYVV